ncbi:MAG: TetR/AcrR family transcriptional regulator [Bacteroidales bacterium]|nr:TetR/AcrR family transcriptional regulator [Bacteroidales bacterium]
MLSERQSQIIDESIKLIAEKGIQGFTIKNLSKAIGISEPAIYRHFDSKTHILLAILDNFKQMAKFLAKMMSEIQITAVEKISFMFEKMVDLFTETPSLVSVLFSEEIFKNEEVLKQKIVEILNTNESTVENILIAGQKKGEIRTDVSEKTLALMVMGSLRLMVKRWSLENYNFNLKKEGKILIESIKTISSK